MRENRLSGSEGGGAQAALPTPIISTEGPSEGWRAPQPRRRQPVLDE